MFIWTALFALDLNSDESNEGAAGASYSGASGCLGSEAKKSVLMVCTCGAVYEGVCVSPPISERSIPDDTGC